MLKIKHLKARAFRGIGSELNLPLNGKSLVLYGDSGTGKSSVAEAIEHAFTGKVEALESSGQQVSFTRHGTHATMRREDTLAQVTVTDGRSDYLLAEGSSTGKSEDVEAFLCAARQGTFILRRGRLLDFIQNAPRNRYEALRPFLGLTEFGAFEQALKEAAEGQERESAQVAAMARSVEASFRIAVGVSEGADLQEEVVLRHLSECVATVGQLPVRSEDDVRNRVEAIGKLLEGYGDISLYQKIHDCRTRTSDFLGTVPKSEDVDKAIEKERELQLLEKGLAGVFYDEVLTSGQKWIREERRESCPLCEQPIADVEALCERIQARIDENAKVIAARAELRRLVPALRTSLKLVIENGKRATEQWETVGLPKEGSPFADIGNELGSLLTALGVGDRVSDPDAAKRSCSGFSLDRIAAGRKESEQTLRGREGKLPEKGKVEGLVQAKSRCQAFLERFKEVCVQGKQVSRCSAIAIQMRNLYQAAVDARKKATQEAFVTLSDGVGRIYESFHPGEDLGELRLDVREYGGGSALIKGRFAHRDDEDPRGFFSEAHLDTLGVAIFLALRKREAGLNPAFKIAVLDDVLTSVDAPHRERVAVYLLSELAADHQIVVTTHSRQWFEWLVELQNQRGLREHFMNKRILDWSLGQGPLIVDMQGDYEFVRNNKDIRPHEQVVPIAGRLLEHMLQELRYSLQLAVQARPDERYTIGDLWPTFYSTVKKRYWSLWEAMEVICRELNDTVVLRNWETHGDEWAKELSKAEAMQFIEPVIAVYEKVYCQRCTMFVQACDVPRGGVSCKRGCLVYFAVASGPDAETDASR
jgi:ribosomal protein L23